MGDEAPSGGLLRSGVRRNSNVRPSTAPAHLGNTNCLLIHAVSFTTRLGNLVWRVDIPSFPSNVWTLMALFTGVVPLYFSFKRVATFTGGPFLAPVRTVPLFQSCKSAFCFRFFYVAAVKQKLACSEEIFTKESLFSVTLTAKVRTHCWYSIVSSFVSLILSLDTVWRQISIWSNLVQFCKQDRHSFATAIGLSRKREIVI